MRVADCGSSTVVVAQRATGVVEAAALMKEYHVGTLVVVEPQGDGARPVGIVTDRDIVVEVVAAGAPADELTVEDVMSMDLVTVAEDTDLFEALARMREQGVRRLPIVDTEGRLSGILSADDALELLAEAIGQLPALMHYQRTAEAMQG